MAYIEVDMPLNNYCYHSLGIKIGGAVWRICSIPFNLPPKVHFCNKLSADADIVPRNAHNNNHTVKLDSLNRLSRNYMVLYCHLMVLHIFSSELSSFSIFTACKEQLFLKSLMALQASENLG